MLADGVLSCVTIFFGISLLHLLSSAQLYSTAYDARYPAVDRSCLVHSLVDDDHAHVYRQAVIKSPMRLGNAASWRKRRLEV